MCVWGVEGGQGWWRGVPEWVRWRRWIVLWFINSSKSLVLFSTAARGTAGSSLHVHQNGSVTFLCVNLRDVTVSRKMSLRFHEAGRTDGRSSEGGGGLDLCWGHVGQRTLETALPGPGNQTPCCKASSTTRCCTVFDVWTWNFQLLYQEPLHHQQKTIVRG